MFSQYHLRVTNEKSQTNLIQKSQRGEPALAFFFYIRLCLHEVALETIPIHQANQVPAQLHYQQLNYQAFDHQQGPHFAELHFQFH